MKICLIRRQNGLYCYETCIASNVYTNFSKVRYISVDRCFFIIRLISRLKPIAEYVRNTELFSVLFVPYLSMHFEIRHGADSQARTDKIRIT